MVRVKNMTNGQTHIGGWVDNVTNRQTHIGGWVENVTNGQTDKRTNAQGVKMVT